MEGGEARHVTTEVCSDLIERPSPSPRPNRRPAEDSALGDGDLGRHASILHGRVTEIKTRAAPGVPQGLHRGCRPGPRGVWAVAPAVSTPHCLRGMRQDLPCTSPGTPHPEVAVSVAVRRCIEPSRADRPPRKLVQLEPIRTPATRAANATHPYSTEVQQRPRTAASSDGQQHAQLAATTAKRPAAQLVREQEVAGSNLIWTAISYPEAGVLPICRLRSCGRAVAQLG